MTLYSRECAISHNYKGPIDSDMYTEQYSAVYQIHMVMTRLYREHKTQDSVECNHVTARDISACMATRQCFHSSQHIQDHCVRMCDCMVVGFSTDVLLV